MEKVITTYEPIAEMGELTLDSFDRQVNETIAGLAQLPEDDLVALENQRLTVEAQLSRNFADLLEGCTNDCWLRPVIKLSDRRAAGGPSLKLFCLPNAPMSRASSLSEQEERCANAHAAARSEFDHFLAPKPNFDDFHDFEG